MDDYKRIQMASSKTDETVFGKDVIPIKLSWRNISYTVKCKYTWRERRQLKAEDLKPEKKILIKESGYVSQGETLYIMGASGAGKTSLLNILCDRVRRDRNSKVKGDVLINDKLNVTKNNFGKYGAYVMQDDILFPTFTCYEALTFAAKLRLGMDNEEIELRVEETIQSLGLENCKDTLVGSNLIRGMSGGEKKRTAIGVEIITNPSLLFLDEPTSGLDSFNADKIVKILSDQAKQGRTIISTIHQPSSASFFCFDNLLLLMEGRTIYHGSAKGAVEYFGKIGYHCPEFTNPADYFIKTFNIASKFNAIEQERVEEVSNYYDRNLREKVSLDDSSIQFPDLGPRINQGNYRRVPWCKEFVTVYKRSIIDAKRNPLFIRARIFQTIFVALLTLSVFFKLGNSTIEDINSKAGFCFFISSNMTFMNCLGVIMSFIRERELFVREYANGTYGIMSYFLSKTFFDLPVLLLIPIVTSLITYFGVGLDPDFNKFCWFTLTLIFLVICSSSLGLLIGSMFTEANVAVTFGPIILTPIVLFAGYFVNLDSVYVWLRWLQYISPMRYSVEVLLRNEFEDKNLIFNPLDQLSYDLGFGKCLFILASLGVFFRILSLVFLKITLSKIT